MAATALMDLVESIGGQLPHRKVCREHWEMLRPGWDASEPFLVICKHGKPISVRDGRHRLRAIMTWASDPAAWMVPVEFIQSK